MPKKSLPIPVIVAFVLLLTLVDALITKFRVFISPASTGVSPLYLNVTLMVVFTLLFGAGALWGIGTLYLSDLVTGAAAPAIAINWFAGNVLVSLDSTAASPPADPKYQNE